MNRLLIYLAIVSIGFSCQSEKKDNVSVSTPTQVKSIDPPLIGFGCGGSGNETKPVELFSELLTEKNYTEIRKKLFSSDPAEKYLATIVCKKLQEKKLIELSKNETKQIQINKRNKDIVSTCSGCTDRDELTVQQLFDPEWNSLYQETENWLVEKIN
jgi:hypothetical protein